MDAQAPVTSLKGVGPSLASLLKRLKIHSIQELLEYVPFRYEDYSKISRISQIQPGVVTLKVQFSKVQSRYVRRGMHLTEATATDETGSVRVVWFNQPYRAKSLLPGKDYYVTGAYAQNYRYLALSNPSCELVSDFPLNAARLVPVYRLTKGLGLLQLRKAIKQALSAVKIAETLPVWVSKEYDLISKDAALRSMHFPESVAAVDTARKRLGFEEVFELVLAAELNKAAHARQMGLSIAFSETLLKEAVNRLPFALTEDQRKVTWQIVQDMQSGEPMNRLLQGDVGSGKTVVAALTALNVLDQGYQIAFMAPTELLATQHATSLQALFASVGYDKSIAVLTGSIKPKEKKALLEGIADGTYGVVIGTHALFQEKVAFKNLGYCIVDEQHRFGVEQRKALQAKAKVMPHVLHMSATPIPRSIALTLYGDMAISLLEQMPAGRKQVQTSIHIAENREKVYGKVIAELQQGRQAFVVCPQIEEGEEGRLSVKKIYEQLKNTWLKDWKVLLLHGKMSAEEKAASMDTFVRGDCDVLVATTVIEVGVNVPNASVMVIEGADSFGLAQLHQLRGRVGRGSDNAYCYLVLKENDPPSQRLRYIESEYSGFKLADYDLQLRGPGAIYGTMQHGALDLRVASLSDTVLIKNARDAARAFIQRGEKLVYYSHLEQRIARLRTITNLN